MCTTVPCYASSLREMSVAACNPLVAVIYDLLSWAGTCVYWLKDLTHCSELHGCVPYDAHVACIFQHSRKFRNKTPSVCSDKFSSHFRFGQAWLVPSWFSESFFIWIKSSNIFIQIWQHFSEAKGYTGLCFKCSITSFRHLIYPHQVFWRQTVLFLYKTVTAKFFFCRKSAESLLQIQRSSTEA